MERRMDNSLNWSGFLAGRRFHDARQPLFRIIEQSRALLEESDRLLTDRQRRSVEAIHDSGHHALSVMNDVIDFAVIDAGKMALDLAPVDLDALLAGVMDIAQWLVQDKPQLELQQDIAPGLPGVKGDEPRIQQILLNLISNATKFTETGFVRVTASRDGDQVVICIEDTGIGIPGDQRDLVFMPFQVVSEDATDERYGLGLGLPISKYLAEAHRGRLWFETQAGQGTAFYFSLPVG